MHSTNKKKPTDAPLILNLRRVRSGVRVGVDDFGNRISYTCSVNNVCTWDKPKDPSK